MYKLILSTSIGLMTPILLSSLGGLFTVLVGSLNISLEGLILISAFITASTYVITGNIFLSIFIAMVITVLIAIIEILINLYFKANIFIIGLGVNMFAVAITSILSMKMFGHKSGIFVDNLNISEYGFNGEFMFNIIVYLSIALCIVSYILIYKTPFGLRLRAIGIDKSSALASNLNIKKYKIIAFALSGAFASLAGSYLFMTVSSYTPNMSAGKGWIALVLIYLGYKKPFGILLASFIFALSEALSIYMQGAFDIPLDIILAIPFIISLLSITIYSRFRKEF